VRRDDGGPGPRYSYLSSSAHGRPRSRCPGTRFRQVLSVPSTPCVLTEGEISPGALPGRNSRRWSMSKEKIRKTVYTHTGWRRIGEAWVYLHGGGGNRGLGGPVPNIEVSLPDPLVGYCFPAIPVGPKLIAAVQASLKILRSGPGSDFVLPWLGAVYRSVLRCADFSIHLSGGRRTGVFQIGTGGTCTTTFWPHPRRATPSRELVIDRQRAGGDLRSRRRMPYWRLMTLRPSRIERGDVQRLHREADRLLRAQGNNSGRQRMRVDGSLRPTKPPRGASSSALGKNIPRGQSLRARLFKLGSRSRRSEPRPADRVPARRGRRTVRRVDGRVHQVVGRETTTNFCPDSLTGFNELRDQAQRPAGIMQGRR